MSKLASDGICIVMRTLDEKVLTDSSQFAQIVSDLSKLLQRCLQVLDDLGGQHIRIGQVGRVFQRFIPQPKDVQVDLVAPISSS